MRRRCHLEDAIEHAEAEAQQLRRTMQDLTAAGQLAGVVQERGANGRYRERLGLMSEIRHDFERMAALLLRSSAEVHDDGAHPAAGATRASTEQADVDAAGDALPRIERIVVYIDDLDRCAPARVVEVLEAVHLLLAVELFTVVVAVDPRWLLRSLTTHYGELFSPPRSPATRNRGGLRAGRWPSGRTATGP